MTISKQTGSIERVEKPLRMDKARKMAIEWRGNEYPHYGIHVLPLEVVWRARLFREDMKNA